MGVTDCFDNTDDIHCFESCRSHGTFCQLTLAAIQLDGAFLEPLVEGASATDESQVFELAETSRTLGPARRGCRNIIVSRSYGADVAQQIRSMTARVII